TAGGQCIARAGLCRGYARMPAHPRQAGQRRGTPAQTPRRNPRQRQALVPGAEKGCRSVRGRRRRYLRFSFAPPLLVDGRGRQVILAAVVHFVPVLVLARSRRLSAAGDHLVLVAYLWQIE